MSKTIQNSHPGERVLYKTRPRFIQTFQSAFLRLIILFLLLFFFSTIVSYFALIQGSVTSFTAIPFVEWSTDVLILFIALLFFSLIWTVLSWRATCYILTNKRVMIKDGVISKKTVYMHFNKVQDIIVSQGFLQRITSCGDIEIFGGRDNTSLIITAIPNPEVFENMINQKIEENDQDMEPEQRGTTGYQ